MRVVPAAAHPTSTPRPQAKQRDPWFDNAKMALIVLVVIGHSWTLLPHNTWDDWTYDFLYFWHIPAFVLVTGYLSASFEWTRPRMFSLVTTVAVPYVIFEGLLVWYRHTFGGVDFKLIWANPHWPMWYLSALFFWRLMTPVFKRLPAKVVVAVAISLLAGLYATNLLDNARIFGMLPFFVLGLKMHEGHWNLLRARRARWYALGVFVALFVLARFSGTWVETEWLYYRTRYDSPGPRQPAGDRDPALAAADRHRRRLRLPRPGAPDHARGSPRWAAPPSWSTCSTGSSCWAWSSSASRGGRPTTPSSSFPLVTLGAAGLALLLAWKPVSSRLNVLVDPVNSFIRWRRARAG